MSTRALITLDTHNCPPPFPFTCWAIIVLRGVEGSISSHQVLHQVVTTETPIFGGILPALLQVMYVRRKSVRGSSTCAPAVPLTARSSAAQRQCWLVMNDHPCSAAVGCE